MRRRDVMSIDVRTLAWLTAAALGAFAAFAVVRNARTPLTQLAIGIVIALALDPVVVATGRRLHLSRRAAVLLVGTAMSLTATAAVVFLAPPARRQASEFTRELPATVQKFEELPLVGSRIARLHVQDRVTRWIDELPARIDDRSMEQAVTRLLSNVVGMLVVGATAVAALLDGEHLVRRLRRLLGRDPTRAERIDRIGRLLYTTLGQYFGGSLTVAVLMGLFVLVVALALGVPLAPVAALWAMFTDLVPQVGGLLGGGLLVLLALAQGPGTAIAAGALFVIYMNIENNLISPAIVGESVDLSPPTTMLAAFIGGAVAGIPGALVATPIVGAVKRLVLETRFGGRPPQPRVTFVDRARRALARLHRHPRG